MDAKWKGSYFNLDEREIEILEFDPLEDKLSNKLVRLDSEIYGAFPEYEDTTIKWRFEPLKEEAKLISENLIDVDGFDLIARLSFSMHDGYRIGILSKSFDDYLFYSMPLEQDDKVYATGEHLEAFFKLNDQFNQV